MRLEVARDLPKGTRVVIGRTRGVVAIEGERVVRFASAPRFGLNSMHVGPITWYGTGGDDVVDLENSNRAVRAYGRGGDDRITGSWKRDVLDGGRGRDVIDGSHGSRPLPARRAALVLRAASLTPLHAERTGLAPDRTIGAWASSRPSVASSRRASRSSRPA